MQVGNEVTSYSSREGNHATSYDRDDSWMSYRPSIMEFLQESTNMSTLPETNSLHLQIGGSKMNFLLGPGLFSGAFAVSSQGCIVHWGRWNWWGWRHKRCFLALDQQIITPSGWFCRFEHVHVKFASFPQVGVRMINLLEPADSVEISAKWYEISSWSIVLCYFLCDSFGSFPWGKICGMTQTNQ